MKRTTWDDLKRGMSPARRAQAEVRAKELASALHLDEVRKARQLSQQQLAETMESTQRQVSKIERSADLYLSTLRRFIEAMDGELVLAARFADGTEVPITLDTRADDEDQAPAAAYGHAH